MDYAVGNEKKPPVFIEDLGTLETNPVEIRHPAGKNSKRVKYTGISQIVTEQKEKYV